MQTAYIAIGDIHGLDQTLRHLLEKLPADGTLVFLGDYVDRGPASREVVDRLLALEQQRACVFLRGNHEDMLLSALDGDQEFLLTWLHNGGLQTLASYHNEIPDEHMAFFRRTRSYFETDDYLFVHGGIPPGEQPEEADPHALYWIRDQFLDSEYDWGKLVIHGHTPVPSGKPDIRPNRINIDTAAVYGGRLTALLLPERKFRSVRSLRK